MTTLPFQNKYNIRTVADAASKACYLCQKTSSKVLITEDGKDFFYCCPSHMLDTGFASPVVDPAVEAEKKKREQLAKDKAAVIADYEAKAKKKKGWLGLGNKNDDQAKQNQSEMDEKLKQLDASTASAEAIDDSPKQYILNRQIFQMRLERRQNLDRAKRDQQRMNTPGLFPTVPKGDPK